MKKIKSLLNVVFFLSLNILCFFKVKKIISSVEGTIQISGLKRDKLQAVLNIYAHFNKQTKMSLVNKLVLILFGNRICFIAEDLIKKEIIAINFFYFNMRDIYEKSIHEGFIGVIDAHQGKGIATKMRKYALQHLSTSNFQGVSTRISKNNFASFNSAKKLGFEVKEEYFDIFSKEERAYLKCNFKNMC